ncbi:HAD family hydrolase [Streptomyces sp. NPDC088910]|uniref:HAD family hydrolase n=1 Tax=Streptomyces sp. NPDC088910 TaxID=3365911 RepID=UPI0038223C1D
MTPTYFESPESSPFALLDAAECLLLDFDGPVCELFARHSASLIAEEMRRYLDRHGIRPPNPATARSKDPHAMLGEPWPPGVAAELERILAHGEESAVPSARETEGADEFVRAVALSGRLLAITTNNSPQAVETYLKSHSLESVFGSRIYGRDQYDPARMKPDPDCLLRAMTALKVRPEQCLMIGDSPRDAEAARAARVRFLGYARSRSRVARLQEIEPHPVVVGMGDLVVAASALSRRPNG